jgi:hypothetical protein
MITCPRAQSKTVWIDRRPTAESGARPPLRRPVALLWSEHENRLPVTVSDSRSGEEFALAAVTLVAAAAAVRIHRQPARGLALLPEHLVRLSVQYELAA